MVHVKNATLLKDPDQFLDLFLLEKREVTGPMRDPQGNPGPFHDQLLLAMRNMTGQAANIQLQEVMTTEFLLLTMCLAGPRVLEETLLVHLDLVLGPIGMLDTYFC